MWKVIEPAVYAIHNLQHGCRPILIYRKCAYSMYYMYLLPFLYIDILVLQIQFFVKTALYHRNNTITLKALKISL